MINNKKTCASTSSVVLAALLFVAPACESWAALPPPEAEPATAVASPTPSPGPAEAEAQPQVISLPVRLRGRLSYDFRGNDGDLGQSHQQGLMATLNASTDTSVWEPWFGRVFGELGFHALQTRTHSTESNPYAVYPTDSSSKDTVITGKAQLTLLPMSRTPFEVHFDRSDSRVASTLSALDGYINERVGFTQTAGWSQGNAMLGWDSSRQTSAITGQDRQEMWRLALTQNLNPEQTIRLNGNGVRNTHEGSDLLVEQNGVYAQHSFRPDDTLAVETVADVSRSRLNMLQTTSDMRQVQFNNYSVWRPTDRPYTVNGGVRVMSMENSTVAALLNTGPVSTRMNNINANVGAAYNLDRFTQLTASAYVNQNTIRQDVQGETYSLSSSQMAGASYRPDMLALGDYQYGWYGSTALANRIGGLEAGNQVTALLGQNLNRTIDLGQGASLSANASQDVSEIRDVIMGSSRKLTHTASVSWNMMRDSSMQMVHLSASDARTWGVNPGTFQMANLQYSSNLSIDRYSSWTGSLTVQAIRQTHSLVFDPVNQLVVQSSVDPESFITTSSGSLSYQNQGLFGVARLRFFSDLRVNSQALMPMVGGPMDQESGAWENRLEYMIGRTQLRFNTRASQVANRFNRAFMFMISRDIGDS
jgi:hypothetical protein